jgi:hypothetical protein
MGLDFDHLGLLEIRVRLDSHRFDGNTVTYKWVVLSNETIGTADRWQKRTGNEIEPPSH